MKRFVLACGMAVVLAGCAAPERTPAGPDYVPQMPAHAVMPYRYQPPAHYDAPAHD